MFHGIYVRGGKIINCIRYYVRRIHEHKKRTKDPRYDTRANAMAHNILYRLCLWFSVLDRAFRICGTPSVIRTVQRNQSETALCWASLGEGAEQLVPHSKLWRNWWYAETKRSQQSHGSTWRSRRMVEVWLLGKGRVSELDWPGKLLANVKPGSRNPASWLTGWVNRVAIGH
jgi:hypothetical protein